MFALRPDKTSRSCRRDTRPERDIAVGTGRLVAHTGSPRRRSAAWRRRGSAGATWPAGPGQPISSSRADIPTPLHRGRGSWAGQALRVGQAPAGGGPPRPLGGGGGGPARHPALRPLAGRLRPRAAGRAVLLTGRRPASSGSSSGSGGTQAAGGSSTRRGDSACRASPTPFAKSALAASAARTSLAEGWRLLGGPTPHAHVLSNFTQVQRGEALPAMASRLGPAFRPLRGSTGPPPSPAGARSPAPSARPTRT